MLGGGHDEFGVGNVSVVQTYFNTFKSFIGIGILATPESFSEIGIVGGVIGVIMIGLLNYYTMNMQVALKQNKFTDVKNYSEMGYAIMGHPGKFLVDLCLIVTQIGVGIAYILFIVDQVDEVMCYETHFIHCKLKVLYACLFTFILVPICWLKTFKYLSYVSLVGNISIVFACKHPNPDDLLYSDCDIHLFELGDSEPP